MLNTIAALATIMAFFFYVFIEWPKIQNRWREAYPAFEKFLMVVSIILGFLTIIPFALAIFVKGELLIFYLSIAFALFGISMLIGYWIENKTFAYRPLSKMGSIWLWILSSLVVGVIGIVSYWFDL